MQSSKGRSVRTSGAVIAAVAILSFAVARVVVPSHEARADAAEPPVPVLVELFTSEGCSSCPSAEDELSRLEAEQPIPGVKVIGVALHVDYWNDLGWADPFSSSKWSDRQHEYDRSRGGRLYTPQAIVQGGRDCVGSDDGTLRSLLRYAGGAPQARVDVTLAAGAPAAVRVSVHVQGLPPVTSGDVAEVRVMLVERGITIDVPRGEAPPSRPSPSRPRERRGADERGGDLRCVSRGASVGSAREHERRRPRARARERPGAWGRHAGSVRHRPTRRTRVTVACARGTRRWR
jgi:hypothetical protein